MSRNRLAGSFASSSGVPHRRSAQTKATSLPGGDLELGDLERGALPLPLEERRRQVPVGGEPSDALVRWWHVEHDAVVRVVLDDRVEIADVDGIGAPPDQGLDLLGLDAPVGCHEVVWLRR